MGLLTSDSSGNRHKLTKLITCHHNKISLVCYLSGILSLGYLVSTPDRTYFSDNALLPGLVQREFTLGSMTSQLLESLNFEARKHADSIPYTWLTSQFRQMGLEVYTHNFSLNYPFGSKPRHKGKNVYAILRAPRSPSTEAIVLCSPYRTMDSPHGSTLPGIALMIALAKHFSSRVYWAKDIIFLISEHELVGMQAWLEAYHDFGKSKRSVLDYGVLSARSGPIQAALNLELHDDRTSRLELKIEGLNGQLPNLDLFNVVVELCTRESITPTFHGKTHPLDGDRFEMWKQYAQTMCSMMISQGITLPTGAHGLFQKYSIQALTLEAPQMISQKNSHSSASLQQIGRVIEGVCRSLNNLLERFNRSYYFYLLTSTRRYISIGYYMIPFALLTVPLLINSLNLYLQLTSSTDNSQETLWNSLPLCFLCHFLGLFYLLIPSLIEKFPSLTPQFSSTDVIYFTIITLSLLNILNPFFRSNCSNNSSKAKSRACIALLNLALVLSCLSLVNVSLAMALSIIYVPIACTLRKCSFWLSRLSNSFMCLLLHPLVINFACLLAMSCWEDSSLPLSSHAVRSFQAQRKVILFFIEDWYIYGNFMYFFASCFLFPSWLQLWHNIR